MAANPEAQEKVYQEINSVIQKLSLEAGPDGPKDPIELVTLESLSRFEYLNGAVNERFVLQSKVVKIWPLTFLFNSSLRLYSPASYIERLASKDITLGTEDGRIRFGVKKGDVVHFPVYSMHRDPEQFPEPEAFKPERFIGEPQFHKYSYLPFGAGPRNCVARSLALLEAKLALLHTFRKYRFSVAPETKVSVWLFIFKIRKITLFNFIIIESTRILLSKSAVYSKGNYLESGKTIIFWFLFFFVKYFVK